MKQWQHDKQKSDVYLPEIKRILGEHLIDEPPIEEDAERNTDLMVLRLDAVRIGCRVRSYGYIKDYGHQFTIRRDRPSGMKTELRKVIEGWGDYFFYGFGDESGQHLARWFIGDYRVFRGWLSNQFFTGKRSWEERKNGDGSSSFMAFNVRDIPGFIVASNWIDDETEKAA